MLLLTVKQCVSILFLIRYPDESRRYSGPSKTRRWYFRKHSIGFPLFSNTEKYGDTTISGCTMWGVTSYISRPVTPCHACGESASSHGKVRTLPLGSPAIILITPGESDISSKDTQRSHHGVCSTVALRASHCLTDEASGSADSRAR